MSASIPIWLEGLQNGDEKATYDFWQIYYPKFAFLADRYMAKKGVLRGWFDGDDAAASALEGFIDAARHGQFDRASAETALIRTLRRHVIVAVNEHLRRFWIRRPNESLPRPDDIEGPSPTPITIVITEEELQRYFARLANEKLRTVARLRFDGHSNEEIAELCGCSLSTVQRRLRKIRDCWSRESP